ncbi:MAG: C40 family peptidase [Bacteroidota bacterium]
MTKIFFAIYIILTTSCAGTVNDNSNTVVDTLPTVQTIPTDTLTITKTIEPIIAKDTLLNTNVPIDSIVNFAETLIGIPYKYSSTNPAEGFDCSGFITYVFNHFNIEVPRSSIDFTNVGTEILLTDAKRGDLILFTGTDSSITVVGHMGIIVSNKNGETEFIHSTSGKANGVVITPLNDYYKRRFVKVVRW